jgi:hypothetical protein
MKKIEVAAIKAARLTSRILEIQTTQIRPPPRLSSSPPQPRQP